MNEQYFRFNVLFNVAKLWCDGMDLCSLRLYDANVGGSDLSSSHHEDTAWFGCESTWVGFYGTTMIFLWVSCADSYESAICGFLVGGITLILRVI